jgi:hypothetical protein
MRSCTPSCVPFRRPAQRACHRIGAAVIGMTSPPALAACHLDDRGERRGDEPRRRRRIRVFDFDPDLLVGLDGRTAALLRQRLGARRLSAYPGAWRYEPADEDLAGHFGLLVPQLVEDRERLTVA